MYSALRTGSVDAAVIVGGSHAANLANGASALGLDVYKHTKGGWKLTKENVDNLLPYLKDTLGSVIRTRQLCCFVWITRVLWD